MENTGVEFTGRPRFNHFCDKRAFSIFEVFKKILNEYSLKCFLIPFFNILISVLCMFRLSSALVEQVFKAGCFMMQSHLSKLYMKLLGAVKKMHVRPT